MKQPLTILHLYPRDMNIYGDHGNLLVLQRRAEWHGYHPVVVDYNVGDPIPRRPDIVIGGGGQDSGQVLIHEDLLAIGASLRRWADDGVPMLMVCGMYQLFGRSFRTREGLTLEGVGIFDLETVASDERIIGNITVSSAQFGDIVGYENHSGHTRLGADTEPLGTVRVGVGNNPDDRHEGARRNNVIGTYLHGSVLPKNPELADFLIETAAVRKFDSFHPAAIDGTFTRLARDAARARPH